MTLMDIVKQTEKLARENSPAILTAFGATGAITTAIFAGKAAYESYPIIKKHESIHGIPDSTKQMYLERGKLVWRLYIPATISGTATIVCIVMAARVGSRRTAAITAAYTLSEKAFVEYKEKVVETLGQNKEQKIRDQIAHDRVTNNPPTQTTIISGSGGDVICCELYTGRYFKSDIETLRKAENEINAELVNQVRATLSDLYYILGLPNTTNADNIGWDSDKLLKLEFTSVLSPDGKPCLAFDYNYTKPV